MLSPTTIQRQVDLLFKQKRYTIRTIADLLAVREGTAAKWCSSGQLKAEKFGRMWLIKKTDLDEFRKTKRERGRPSKKEKTR